MKTLIIAVAKVVLATFVMIVAGLLLVMIPAAAMGFSIEVVLVILSTLSEMGLVAVTAALIIRWCLK